MKLQSTGVEKVVERASDSFDHPLFEIAGTHITIATLVSIGLVLAGTLVVANLVSRLFGRMLRRHGKTAESEVRSIVRIVRYSIWAGGVAIALSTAGINLSALFAAGAVFAVAIGFAMQNIAQNFVSGVILLIERTIKPGDILELDGHMVKVVQMGIRTTIARTLDEEDIIVPNATLVQASVKNFTLRDPEYRVRVQVGVAYSSDMARVRQVLTEAARDVPSRLPDREPRILLIDFGASSVDWEVSVWIDDPWQVRSRRSELLLAVWDALRVAGITIAFPQLDVHLDPPADGESGAST